MTKKINTTAKSKKKVKTKIKEDQDIYIGFEPMGEMKTIPAKSTKKDFPLKKSKKS